MPESPLFCDPMRYGALDGQKDLGTVPARFSRQGQVGSLRWKRRQCLPFVSPDKTLKLTQSKTNIQSPPCVAKLSLGDPMQRCPETWQMQDAEYAGDDIFLGFKFNVLFPRGKVVDADSRFQGAINIKLVRSSSSEVSKVLSRRRHKQKWPGKWSVSRHVGRSASMELFQHSALFFRTRG